MSYQQLQECRELDRLAAELGFELYPAQGEILLRCRKVHPDDDPTGQTVVSYNVWTPYCGTPDVMFGSVSEVLSFLRGIQFMKTHVETHLGMKKQLEQTRRKMIQNLQHNATFNKLSQ